MSATTYIQKGEEIDYTPTSADVHAGDVVVQNLLVGVAKHDIPQNTLGALAVKGVFRFPKAAGSGTGILAGKVVYWDAVNGQATENAASGANVLLGKTVLAAADADATVLVRLFQ